MFYHTKNPIVEFRKWMCDFGMRAATSEDTTTYTFDLQGYNDTAYRLTSGGRNAGGRPNLKYTTIPATPSPVALMKTDAAMRQTGASQTSNATPAMPIKPEATNDADKECPDAGDTVAGKKRKRFSQAEDDSTETEFGTPPPPRLFLRSSTSKGRRTSTTSLLPIGMTSISLLGSGSVLSRSSIACGSLSLAKWELEWEEEEEEEEG